MHAADNKGLLALNVNKTERPRSLLTHQETVINLLHFYGNTRWGSVGVTRLTRALAEVTSDAAIDCSSAPAPESTTLTLLSTVMLSKPGSLTESFICMSACCLHVQLEHLQVQQPCMWLCTCTRLYSHGTFIMRSAEHKYTVRSTVHWDEPSHYTHIQ